MLPHKRRKLSSLHQTSSGGVPLTVKKQATAVFVVLLGALPFLFSAFTERISKKICKKTYLCSIT